MLTYTLLGLALAAVVYLFTRKTETDVVVEMEEWEANPLSGNVYTVLANGKLKNLNFNTKYLLEIKK